MGVTSWIGETHDEIFTVKPRGGKGAYYVGEYIYPSKCVAMENLLRTDFVVMERGMGHRANIVNAQAHLRGYITALADVAGIPIKEINVLEWRRVVREQMGVSFPRQPKDCKILAQQLVKKHFGVDASEDEADSLLAGYAAMKLGYVNV